MHSIVVRIITILCRQNNGLKVFKQKKNYARRFSKAEMLKIKILLYWILIFLQEHELLLKAFT